jgi:hypothetical protein
MITGIAGIAAVEKRIIDFMSEAGLSSLSGMKRKTPP